MVFLGRRYFFQLFLASDGSPRLRLNSLGGARTSPGSGSHVNSPRAVRTGRHRPRSSSPCPPPRGTREPRTPSPEAGGAERGGSEPRGRAGRAVPAPLGPAAPCGSSSVNQPDFTPARPVLPVLYPRRLLVSLLRCEPGARPPLPLRLRLGECAGGGARGSAERRGEERRGAERDRLPPARPGCGQPRGRSPPRAGSAAMEPPAGFACVLLCCALCLPAAAPRRPGHRGRCAPGPAAARRLRAARFALSPPEGAGQPARLKSRLRAPRFAAPPELLLRALLPGFQLRAAGEDGDRDRDGDANGDAERRRRHRAVPALPPLPDLHGAGLGPGVPGAG